MPRREKDLYMEPWAVRPVIDSNGIPYLEMMSVGSLSMPRREKDMYMEPWAVAEKALS